MLEETAAKVFFTAHLMICRKIEQSLKKIILMLETASLNF